MNDTGSWRLLAVFLKPTVKENNSTSNLGPAHFHKAKRLHRALVKKFSMSLGIPVSEYVHTEGPLTAVMPYLKPTDIFSTILTKHPWLLLGGSAQADSEEVLMTFWKCYQQNHPEHEVFQHGWDRLRRTVPVTVHGDGGRTQKKQPLEIFSVQPVIGLNTRVSRKRQSCHCDTSVQFGCGDATDPMTQRLNSKRSTFLTHFLIFAFPSKSSKNFSSLLTSFLGVVCSNLASLCNDGAIGFDQKRWYFACVGFKLDMEWMVKVGSLTRSYQNVGYVREIPVCHECDAGSPGIAFENVNPSATWTRTLFRTLPWVVQPPWSSIPFEAAKPAKFLRRDSFHIFRMGIGRNFLASCVYLLCYMNCSSDIKP